MATLRLRTRLVPPPRFFTVTSMVTTTRMRLRLATSLRPRLFVRDMGRVEECLRSLK